MEKNQYRVLIVEDNLVAALHLETLLTRNGYEVVGKLQYGEQLKDKVAAEEPDVILLDHLLKGTRTGAEAALDLREDSRMNPIVFITAMSDKKTVQAMSSIERSVIIHKPFHNEVLLRTIKDHIDAYLIGNKAS